VTASLLSIPVARSNLDWGAGAFIGVIFSVVLYLWLMAAGSRAGMDLSLPYSFKQPFLPMRKFPLRYWFVVSYSLVIGGAVAVLRDLIERDSHAGVGGSFLIAGLFIAATLTLWAKTFASTRH
jgi:hypothetical protein